MFISQADFGTVLVICVSAGVVALTMAALLGRSVAADSKALRSALRVLGRIGPDHQAAGRAASRAQARHGELADLEPRAHRDQHAARRVAGPGTRTRAIAPRTCRLGFARPAHPAGRPACDGRSTRRRRRRRSVRATTCRCGRRWSGSPAWSATSSSSPGSTLARCGCRCSRCRLADLVDDAVAGAHPLARARRVRLAADIDSPLAVQADAREMSRALTNLVVNAIRHTPERRHRPGRGRPARRLRGAHRDRRLRRNTQAHLARVFDVALAGQRCAHARPVRRRWPRPGDRARHRRGALRRGGRAQHHRRLPVRSQVARSREVRQRELGEPDPQS